MDTIVKQGERVRSSTSRSQNQKVDEIVSNVAHYSSQGAAVIEDRVRELDQKYRRRINSYKMN